MQVFSPTACASGALGFSATCAFANPGAGLGRWLRSAVSSVERFVDGRDLETSSRAGWDWPIANVDTSNTAPRLAVIHKLSRPKVIPLLPILLNCRSEIGAANFRLIASNRAECAYLFFVYEAH